MFSGPAEVRRSDLLDIVSVLDHDLVLQRVADVAVARTGARTAVLAVLPGLGGPVVHARGLPRGRAAALRRRLGDAGLEPSEDAAADPDVHRLVDPETGGEVLRVPIRLGRHPHADLLLVDPEGGAFDDTDVEGLAVLGRVAAVAVRNAVTYAASERRREAGEAAARVADALRLPDAEHEALVRLTEGAALISGADLAAVVRAGDDGTEVAALLGEPEELTRLLEHVGDRLARVQQAGADLEELPGDGSDVVLLPLRPDLARPGVVLLQLHPERGRGSLDERELLTRFTAHGSLVLDHAAFQAERHRALLADERDRIARDMHDVVIQRLIATGLKLRAAHRGAADAEELVTTAVTDLEESVRDIRTTIFELERGDGDTPRGELLALVREYETVLGFSPRTRIWGPVDTLVDRALAEHVTAVLRELLSNCARHAEATVCQVDVGVGSGWLHLVVEDDGRGPGAGRRRSGLRNLRARAERLGGWLSVDGLTPTGTRAHWAVPLDLQASDASPAEGGVEPGAGDRTGAGDGVPGRSSAAPADSSSQHAPVTER